MSRIPRILFYSDARKPGGAEVYLGAIASGARAAGYATEVVTTTDAAMDDWVAEISSDIHVHRLPPLKSLRPLRDFRRHMTFFLRNRFAAVHFNQVDPWSCAAGIVAARFTGLRRLFSTSHLPNTVYDVPTPWRARIAPHFLRRILLVGQCHLDALRSTGGGAEKYRVVVNGVPITAPPDHAARQRARAALGVASDAVVVGTVGRMTAQKNQAVLLRAAAAWPDARVVLVGEGPERDALEELARTTGIASRVVFAGHRPDARALLPAFDVFVLPSRYEGLPLALLEAMAACVPVVASDLPETREVVRPEADGVLVTAADAAALATAVSTLLDDADRRVALGTAARARVTSAFDEKRMVVETIDQLREVLQ